MLDFTNKIASKSSIPDTLFNYQIFDDVRNMVNEKKHDKLLAVVSAEDAEYLIENSNFKMILPIKDQKGWTSFMVEPGAQVKGVTEYRFAYNDHEIGKFCLFAINATEHVVNAFYKKYFA